MLRSAQEVASELVAGFAGDDQSGESLRAAFDGFVAAAQATWPEVKSTSPRMILACFAATGVNTAERVAAVDAGEVWLAAACADGDAGALTILEREYIVRLGPALRSLDLDQAAVDDVQQRVRERLLTAEADKPIRLLEYAGQGRLAGLVKVVAIRMNLDDKRRLQRAPDGRSADERTLERVMDGDLGPELAVIEAEHRSVVKQAFQEAIDGLDAKERGILRLHLLQRSSIDEIAALHDVHRATAARWINSIRSTLAMRTRGALQAKLALDDDRLASLLQAVDSRIDLSLSRVLTPSTPADSDSEDELG